MFHKSEANLNTHFERLAHANSCPSNEGDAYLQFFKIIYVHIPAYHLCLVHLLDRDDASVDEIDANR